MLQEILKNRHILLLMFIFLITGCCKEGDVNYFIPPYIIGTQQIPLKVEYNYSLIVNNTGQISSFLPGTSIFIYPNTKNEFFSISRIDEYTGLLYTIYWQSGYVPFSVINDPKSIFRPLLNNEEVSVYNCVFVQSNNLSCYLKQARPETTTKMYVVVEIKNGQKVDEQLVKEKASNEIGTLNTYGYYLTTLKARIKSKGDYTFEIVANVDSTASESNYNDNKYITRMSIR